MTSKIAEAILNNFFLVVAIMTNVAEELKSWRAGEI